MQLDAADVKKMNDGEKLAVLEALVTAVLCDGEVSPGEVRRFDEIVLGLPWDFEPGVLEALVKGTQQRVAGLGSLPAITDFVANVAARLPAPELREKVVYTMARVISADGKVAQRERNVLGLFVLSFGITTDRAAAIREAVIASS